MSATERPSVLFVGVAYNLTWAVFLIDSLRYVHDPIYAVRDPLLSLFARISRSESLIGSVVKTVTVSFALSTNVFALMAASSVILVMVIALIHRFLWPIVGRLLNAVYEWELLSNPATQLCAGIAFLAFAFPIIAKILALFKPMVK